ncbi:TrbC/VIRB2 family protein [Poriferisphaera corsica]|uniref:TrbC/VIRB2 family protein n=1 Tax=Poriferisphaera corsica TaxID=2528020 RepID=A0A517YSQ9_9BACT|nr:TrbC/VirB2 family protein [Poriferisphaera corsica]QDU33251.1 TrbC/VIRB2 family protein [Poriferisphaera corsica]
MSPRLKKVICACGVLGLMLVLCSPALAGTSTGMPWEDKMEAIQNFFTGPFAKVAGVIAIVVLGVSFAMAEGAGGTRRLIGVFFGLALAFSAVSWGLDFLGFKDSGLAEEYQGPAVEMRIDADEQGQAATDDQVVDVDQAGEIGQPEVAGQTDQLGQVEEPVVDESIVDEPVADELQVQESDAQDVPQQDHGVRYEEDDGGGTRLEVNRPTPAYMDQILHRSDASQE